MDHYGLEMEGPIIIEKVNDMPVWSETYKGRLIWDYQNNKYYVGGASSWIDVGEASKIEVGDDADGDMYYRALGTLARLPKGLANQKLFMEDSGDYPEWGNSSKIVNDSFSAVAASGSHVITGVGFKPSFVVCLACHNDNEEFSYGFTNRSLNNYCIYQADEGGRMFYSGSYCSIIDVDHIGVSTGDQQIKITAFSDDGFTYTNTKVGTFSGDTIYLIFLCFR